MAKRAIRPGEIRCPRCGARLPITPHPSDATCCVRVYCAACGDQIQAKRTAQGAWTLNFGDLDHLDAQVARARGGQPEGT